MVSAANKYTILILKIKFVKLKIKPPQKTQHLPFLFSFFFYYPQQPTVYSQHVSYLNLRPSSYYLTYHINLVYKNNDAYRMPRNK